MNQGADGAQSSWLMAPNDTDSNSQAANYQSFEDQFLENSIVSNFKKLLRG